MRVRVFKDSTESDTAPVKTIQNGIVVYDSPLEYQSKSQKSWMIDTVTPNFRKKVREGAIINNDLVFFQEDSTYLYNHFHGTGADSSSYEWWAPMGGFPAPPTFPRDTNDLDNYLNDLFGADMEKAVTDAWANVDESATLVFATLGEGQETINYLVSLMRRVIYLFNAIRVRQFYKTNLRWSTSELWMEIRYGLRPLIFDFYNTLKALRGKIDERMRNVGRGYVSPPIQEGEQPHVWNISNSATSITYSHQWGQYVNIRAGVLYSINSSLGGAFDRWGANQTIETIWELVPFSFILDWFFNVSKTLSSWSVSANLSPLASWVVIDLMKHDRYIDPIFLYKAPYPNSMWNISAKNERPGYMDWSVRVKRRYVSPKRSIIPKLDLRLDLSKLLDLSIIAKGILQAILERRR